MIADSSNTFISTGFSLLIMIAVWILVTSTLTVTFSALRYFSVPSQEMVTSVTPSAIAVISPVSPSIVMTLELPTRYLNCMPSWLGKAPIMTLSSTLSENVSLTLMTVGSLFETTFTITSCAAVYLSLPA